MAELKLIRADRMEASPPKSAVPVEGNVGNDAMGRRRTRIIGVIATIVLIVGGWLAFQYVTVWSKQESTDNAYVRADITPVAAKVDGYIARLLVDDNRQVKAGEVIAIIEPADYQARVAQAEAQLAAAKANIGTLSSQRQSAVAQVGAQAGAIEQASAQAAAARASAARAEADERRYSELARQGWVTRAQLDQVRSEALAARAQAAAAQAAIAAQQGQSGALSANVTGSGSQIEAGQAQVRLAEAALQAAKLDLDRTVIRAPIDGVVANRTVRAGQYIRAGQQLLSVVPVQAAYVIANFKETQVGRMRVGQRAEITVDAYPGRELHGRVESIAPASGAQFSLIPTDTATGNFTKIVQRVPVKIVIDPAHDAAGLLRPGLSVEATVVTGG